MDPANDVPDAQYTKSVRQAQVVKEYRDVFNDVESVAARDSPEQMHRRKGSRR